MGIFFSKKQQSRITEQDKAVLVSQDVLTFTYIIMSLLDRAFIIALDYNYLECYRLHDL